VLYNGLGHAQEVWIGRISEDVAGDGAVVDGDDGGGCEAEGETGQLTGRRSKGGARLGSATAGFRAAGKEGQNEEILLGEPRVAYARMRSARDMNASWRNPTLTLPGEPGEGIRARAKALALLALGEVCLA